MADVTQLRFAALLKQAFGLKTADPGRILGPVITPVISTVDAYVPEFRLSRGERMWGGGANPQNGVGANFSQFVVYNPPGSNRMGVIKRVTFSGAVPTAAAQPGILSLYAFAPNTSATSGTARNLVFKDGRLPQNVAGQIPALQGLVGTGLGPSALDTLDQTCIWVQQVIAGAAATPFSVLVDQLDLVLPPGTRGAFALTADTNTVTAYSWNVFVEGYERVVDPNELLTAPP